ncbi:hypothetical protein D7X55_00025 [Corallococcus sp. AB049A]|uniref:Uncharacterized protein n=1 Tax=Corallococcus interemptor TaxID=2316720 RepID=A0A3A8R2N9_9BACT|nr:MULTISPECIES: hypothetical protein [Corallococcus]RKH53155.1 hypothetical protein D7Y23_04690 [Corallococcus sp. AB050B]RKH73045.1 hypothetical protein D7X96_03055 [Corallococcus interemptor]RKI75360.1 hypothetical protein D7X55_00025 [Corallococcus sp. AB049A]
MLESRRRNSGRALSSLLSLALLVGGACGPNPEQDAVSTASPNGDNTPGSTDVASPDAETLAPSSPEESTAVPGEPESEDVASAPVAEADAPAAAEAPATATESEGLGTTAQAATSLRTVAAWETLFLNRWNSEHTSSFLPKSQSLDSWQFYDLAYGIDGNTAMYRATGKTQYMDRALLYVNNMVNHAKVSSSLPRSQFKDSYLGWASARSDTLGQEVPLFESYCWRYVTRMLRTIRETPALYGNSNYKAQYDKLLAFTERNMFEKWMKRGANSYIYRVNTHMASHWAYISMDLSKMTTDATKRAQYMTVFNNINRDMPNNTSSLRGQLMASPVNANAYFWAAEWGSKKRPGQDVAHGNGVMAYIVEAHDAGMEWTDADMRKFVTTLNNVIWPSAKKYGNYVDGTGSGTGWFNDGLVKLGRYNAALQQRLETHTVGQNTQYYGNGALNAKLLSQGSAL